jgi:hypothetical protein
MKPPLTPTSGLVLGLIGVAASLAGVAISLDEIHTSHEVVWSVAGIAVLCFASGLVIFVRRGSRAPPGPKPNPRLAAECRRLAKALATFIDELANARLAMPVGGPSDEWQVEARRRYRDEFAGWAVRVFSAAVEAGAIVDCSQNLVKTPAPTQLHVLRDLFLEAALALDPSL